MMDYGNKEANHLVKHIRMVIQQSLHAWMIFNYTKYSIS